MKIIHGSSGVDVARHAQILLKNRLRRGLESGQADPLNVPIGLAKFMHSCDDCGQIYWDSDEYGYSHPNCPGRKKVGF